MDLRSTPAKLRNVLLQALMPASVFVVGCGIGTESFNLNTAANMVRDDCQVFCS